MALYFKRKELDKHLVNRIIKELVLNNGKEYMKFYKIIGDFIAVPYFYGRMILMNWKLPFSEAHTQYEQRYFPESNSELESEFDLESLPHLNRPHTQISFISTYKLREKQIPILKTAKNYLESHGTVLLKVATGFGKSIALLHLIRKMGLLTVILVTRLTFLSQIKNTFDTNTDAIVWIPGGKHKNPPANVQVIITTPQRFSHISEELRLRIGILAIDEAPLICTEQCISPILSLRPRYIIACSATIDRRDGMHVMLNMLYGPSKVDKGLDIPVRLIKWLSGIKVPYVKGKKGPDWAAHCEFICSNEDRNRMIVSFAKQILEAPKDAKGPVCDLIRKISNRSRHKIVMITNRVKDHVMILKPLLLEAGITCDYMDAHKHTYLDSDVVIGTSGKLGIGFDSALTAKNYDGCPIDVVIQLVSTATESLFVQELGRACRVTDGPAIFVSIIDHNRISAKHCKVANDYVMSLDDGKKFLFNGDPDVDDL